MTLGSRSLVHLALAHLLLGFAAAMISAALPDETLAAKVEAIRDWQRQQHEGSDWEATECFVKETLRDVDFAALDADELHMLARILANMPFEYGAPADNRMKDLMSDRGADGAVAATARLIMNYQRYPDRHKKWLGDAITHPGLLAALEAGRASEVWLYVPIVTPDALVELKDEILDLKSLLTDDLPPQVVLDATYLDRALRALDESVDEARREHVRQRLVDLLESAEAQAAAMGDPDLANRLLLARAQLEGRWRLGQLVGHPAPEVTFDAWIGRGPVESLEDLHGNVVVLDIWTTWCTACIAAFPKIRELQEQFSDERVRIIGLTWLQGTHFQRGREPLDTRGEPNREYAAMAGLVSELDLTWPIAFASGKRIRDFGIESVPQLVIIDADGIVREHLAGFTTSAEEVARVIEALLAQDRPD